MGLLVAVGGGELRGDEPSWGVPTLGGRQFWSDVHFFHDWRIQQHVLTGHYRLLDDDDGRHASGRLDECVNALGDIRRTHQLAPMSGKAVVFVHGILRSAKSFDAMAETLDQAGYLTLGFTYPSTRITIPAAADNLARALASLEGVEEIHFVGHSMGGLVVRAYLAKQPDPRCTSLVMLGVPNQGADLAASMGGNPLFRLLYGPAGQQLATGDDCFAESLPTPKFPFAIISGGRGDGRGYNPLIAGDNDGTLAVECTRLAGAADFLTVSCMHSFLPSDDEAIAATLHFLEHGRLRAHGPPQPIRE